jgi:cytochrome P450
VNAASPVTESPPPLFSPEFQRDPYPTYTQHRQGPPLQPLPGRPGLLLVFGYADCVSLFRAKHLSSRRPASALIGATGEELTEFEPLVTHMHRWLLMMDAPAHPALRKLLNPTFSPARVELLRSRVDTLVKRLLDKMEDISTPDIIRDLAYPLPVQVISDMLGLPEELHERCTVLTNDIANWFGHVVRTPERARVAAKAVEELEGYFADLIRQRREKPSDDLISLLMAIADGGERLSDEELYAQCVMMLFAGHETTRHLIGNGVQSLLSHPEALQEVRSDPTLIPNAIEESLRFESPIQMMSRGVTADIEFDGGTIPAGSSLIFMVGSAQRDSRQYSHPERLDLHRQHIRHFGFGGDVHTCLGATLARLESQAAVSGLLFRFPRLSLATERPDWGSNFAIRGLNSLTVNLTG